MKVKTLSKEYHNKVVNFPNFDKSGSIRGMKNFITAKTHYLLGVVDIFTM